MQDVSYEPLMLCLSENPQASLDIFSQLHHHPAGSLHPSQGDKQEKTFLSSGWYPTTGKTSTCKAKRFIPVYRLGEDGGLHFNEGADMHLIWLLRARSYKTKAEV